MSSLLSHRTRNADSGRAFKALRQRFPDWADVIAAPTDEVEALIHGVRWPELKAPRIQAILAGVRERAGQLDLGFLADMAPEAARAWLEALPGVDRRPAPRSSPSRRCACPPCRWTAITTASRSGSG